jgi:hypothetical protein
MRHRNRAGEEFGRYEATRGRTRRQGNPPSLRSAGNVGVQGPGSPVHPLDRRPGGPTVAAVTTAAVEGGILSFAATRR